MAFYGYGKRPKVGAYLSGRDYAFAQLVCQPQVQEFLENDRCNMIADNYLLSMAYVYMKRANYHIQTQYTFFNLLVALFLAHEMEEDDMDVKMQLVRVAMGDELDISLHSMSFFSRCKVKLWTELQYFCLVQKDECIKTMMSVLPGHYIWRRNRHESHGGAPVRFHIKQAVFNDSRFRLDMHSFRCLMCEGIRFLAERARLRYEKMYGRQVQMQVDAAGSCRSMAAFRPICSRSTYTNGFRWEE